MGAPVVYLACCLLPSLVSGQLNPSTVPTTTPDDGDFFDDDNNKAMYLVLPAMILIYGGCAFIYCFHRCRRYCTRKSRAKAKEERKKARHKERLNFSNQLVSAKDPDAAPGSCLTERVTNLDRQGQTSMQLQSLEEEDEEMNLVFKKGRGRPKMQETNVDGIEDCLQTDSENCGAVAPGYADGNLSQEMMHLDNQLKAAFRLTQDASKAAVPESNPDKSVATATTTFAFNKNDKFSEDPAAVPGAAAAAVASNPKAPANVKQEAPGGGKSSKVGDTNVIPIAKEDIESILKIRKKVKKPPAPPVAPDLSLRSQPDLVPMPHENVIEIRRVQMKVPKDRRRFYLSSQ
ncbi:hypothetical protein ElyMa_003720800 [Elysia marginata]|uniref:Uncharacterized protein n=1 Tax=Elysia marginata TaxID=1093978 RepID=A0AAV4F492_9GAST|nr:hypothetical protein ElyMa_003720800 [Elysia marginata]